MEMAQITRGMSAATEAESIIARVNKDRLLNIGEPPREPRTAAAVAVSAARKNNIENLQAQLAAVNAEVTPEHITGSFSVPGDRGIGKKPSRFVVGDKLKPKGPVKSRFTS